jgi:hypothetical protein
MEFDRFHQFGSLLLHDDFVLSYSGYVTEDILEAVGATLRQRLADHIDNPKQIRNVFSIFVELMQNVIRYGTDEPQHKPQRPRAGTRSKGEKIGFSRWIGTPFQTIPNLRALFSTGRVGR